MNTLQSTLNDLNPADYLPHRAPFLFVDRLLEITPKVLATYTHCSSSNIMGAHFPGNPIIPGVLLLEGLFQTAALWMSLEHKSAHQPADQSATPMVTRVDQVKFKLPGKPDLPLYYEVTLLQELGSNILQCRGVVKQAEKILVQCEFVVGLF